MNDVYYHLSPVRGLQILKPLSREYSNDRGMKLAPKISLGDTIYGSIHALMLPGWARHFCYSPDDQMIHLNAARVSKQEFMFTIYESKYSDMDKRSIVCSTADPEGSGIFDILLTGELGYSQELPCRAIGEVIIKMCSRTNHLKQFPHKLNATMWCMMPKDTAFTLELFNFEVRPTSPNSTLTSQLEIDRQRFTAKLSQAFHTYIKYIEVNSKRTIAQYQKALNSL